MATEEERPTLDGFISNLFTSLKLENQDESQIEYTARLVEEDVRSLGSAVCSLALASRT
jgi:hypothetical protein